MTRQMGDDEWYVEFTVCAWCRCRFYGNRQTCSETCRLYLHDSLIEQEREESNDETE